jgi:signal transduction histidine kinase/DNA-binding response OmpR family regulator
MKANGVDAGGTRVLVVEDDSDHALLIRRTLERHRPPFEVAVVGGGAACLAALAEGAHALVLLDYSLPGMNGVDVLHEIRREDRLIPVVMVTGQGDERLAVAAMQAGATDYVVKTSGYLAALPTVLYKVLEQQELAVENARLQAETERRLRESEALLELARSLTATIAYRPLLARIARAAARVCEMDRCSIFQRVGDAVVPVMSQFADGRRDLASRTRFRKLGPMRIDELPALADVIARGAVVVMDDPRLPGNLGAFGSRALLALPLARGGRVFGALVLDNVESRAPVTPVQISLATAAASHVAMAVENARLYQEARQALADLRIAQEHLVRGETLRALGELASGAAHHLNNLLAVIVGRIELLRMRGVPEWVRRPLDIVHRAARDSAEVVRRIQQFSRTTHPRAPEAVDLNHVITEVMEMTRERWSDEARAQGLSIDVLHEPGVLPVVAGDAAALREVVTNLVLNAVDALPDGGRITVRTWAERDAVVLSVTDNGVGMPEHVRRQALEPFFTTKGVKSTGLGLSVSYGIVRRHGGDLAIEGAEGRGTRVVVRLPAGAPGMGAPPVDAHTERVAGLRVLVIDDEPEVLEMLAELMEAEGHTVLRAADPREALRRMTPEAPPDLVLTDLGMPDMTGWHVALAVKHRWPEVPVGLITGWGTEPPATPGERAAVDFILSKPIDRGKLRRSLAAVAASRRTRGVRPATAGGSVS